MKKLGKSQLAVLRSLYEHNGWYSGCGWIWNTYSGTRRIIHTLVKIGLVDTTYQDTSAPRRDRFNINEAGKEVLFKAYPLLKLIANK
jgi:DNA-binding PadR family transcriptional regulator